MTATQERPADEVEREIGRDRRRKEDQRLITGRTRWTDNITLPGMLHLAMVRSPFAHATITSIDTTAAKASTNVVAVLTGADFGDELGVCINAWAITTDQVTPTHSPMPSDRVSFAGEIVAVVVARTAAEARDAAELVDVEYDELPAALDLKKAAADEVLAHPDLGTNKSALWVFDSGEAGTGGNVEEAIAKARTDGIVIEREYRQQRLIPAFMEPRSVVVDPTGEQNTMWSATQIPHIVRFALAATTGVPESKIRVVAPDVGGGFGGKLQVTPEEWIAWAVGRRLGKPVKYTETRSESLLSAHHGRDQWQKLTLAAEKDGSVTGFKVELLADLGAYVAIVGGGVPVLGAFMFNSIYKFPAYHFACQTVLTNKTWTDAYRGAGRPEATYAIERIMDELAAEVGVDPLVIREKNWIKHEEFPFTTVAGLEYDSGNYEAATARAKEMFGYDELRAEQKQRRESGDTVQLGLGISTFTEMCGLAPSRVLGQLNYGAGGWEHASVRMLATGKVEVITGASAHGQGHETAFSQIVADRLGVAFEDVEVLHGDTQISHKGLDTYGSRSLVVGGEALVRAVDKVIEKARPIAAHLLEASVDDLEYSGGRFSVKGTDQGLAIGEIATAVFTAHNLPDDVEPSIDAEATYDPVNFNYPHGTHLCAMEVDTETGAVKMRKYVCCDDIGNIINPLIVAGQVHGGLVQGIAQALWEEAVYDDAGTLVSGSFVDYLLPTAADTISFEVDHTTSPSTTNTLGTKGVGEAGTIASTPAVVNAVVDAVRHLGVNDIQMPCTPERVWKAINGPGSGGATEGAAMPHFESGGAAGNQEQPGQSSTEGAGS
ncbi:MULTISPECIES: xanthine dehydrogenase family protein molybdopterin-binding subunit [unclassified Nocardioides]|uniref:xanthine dehydrogenase family protein molybdopterin-binding subunit n=1 Tax=unclassified Nocardioides TaxID=2615069 RepID=UPI0009F1450C|nr:MULTISPECIES: xanthine dehydrogenase family protein molybdopterin-binding subunit [unclassified Nocardioides]GAW50758.1 carbon-monoxide dehydrogenase large subunit [Nocardioides sp. PD653-B2]GAW55497.1 carbon-monoxide dehydrogenase large subunit [Nocardioides sp. PD653]